MDVWKSYILYEEPKKELLSDSVIRELTYLIEAGFHSRTVRPEAAEALEALSSFGLKMGIISNVLSSTQVPNDLKRYGLENYFSPVITSADLGGETSSFYIYICCRMCRCKTGRMSIYRKQSHEGY